ncbi:MAG: shikimate dehydrogenase family protein, partial [Kiloniellaceae bacterium]
MILSGQARLAGVIGWPVAHSRSPRVHGYWLEQHGIDGAYVPLAVRPGAVEPVVRALAAAGFRGLNVTVPHKEAVLDMCDAVDETARRVGAVNTLVFEGERILGRNTDGFGFVENMRAGAPGWRADAGPAVVLGAGGAARAVAAALADRGAPEVRIANRTAARAESLAASLGGPVRAVPWAARDTALSG